MRLLYFIFLLLSGAYSAIGMLIIKNKQEHYSDPIIAADNRSDLKSVLSFYAKKPVLIPVGT